MIYLIQADFKKVLYLQGCRVFLLATLLLSVLFGILFLFTLDLTAGKKLTELSNMEIVDITLLGIDVTAIMLIIFTANFIAKEFSTGTIHTSLAITPLRQKYFVGKLLLIAKLSILFSSFIICILMMIDYFILTMNNMNGLILDTTLMIKLIGAVIMPVFYSLLSMAGTFFTQSASGGITFSLSVMFLPALINMFPTNFTDFVLPLLPESSLRVFSEISSGVIIGTLINAIIILMLWMLISTLLGYWKFKRADF